MGVEKSERNSLICSLRNDGHSFAEISIKLDVSQSRARAIFKKYKKRELSNVRDWRFGLPTKAVLAFNAAGLDEDAVKDILRDRTRTAKFLREYSGVGEKSAYQCASALGVVIERRSTVECVVLDYRNGAISAKVAMNEICLIIDG